MDLPYQAEQQAVAIVRDGSTRIYAVDTVSLPGKTAVMNDAGGRAMFGDQDWELALEGYHPDITLTRIPFHVH